MEDTEWRRGGDAHLLRLVEEEEDRLILLAEAEAEDEGTLEDFSGEIEPWLVTGFILLLNTHIFLDNSVEFPAF